MIILTPGLLFQGKQKSEVVTLIISFYMILTSNKNKTAWSFKGLKHLKTWTPSEINLCALFMHLNYRFGCDGISAFKPYWEALFENSVLRIFSSEMKHIMFPFQPCLFQLHLKAFLHLCSLQEQQITLKDCTSGDCLLPVLIISNLLK